MTTQDSPELAEVERFRELLEAAPVAMVVVDASGRIVLVNAQVEALFSYGRDELVGQPVELLVPGRFRASHAGHRQGFYGELRARPMGAGRDLLGLRKDGTEVPVEVGLSPLRAAGYTFVLGSIVDLSERKRSSEALQASLREKEALLEEVHHRVKNNLQVISSLLNLRAHHAEPGLAAALLEMQARVRSIALLHERLYQSDDLARVSIGEYLRDLTSSLFHQYDVDPERIRLDVRTADVRFGVSRAIPCGLIANELVTNALKHAFPGGRAGTVCVSVALLPTERAELVVADDGIGIPRSALVSAEPRTLGLQLVRTLVRQIEGSIDVQTAGGTRFEVRFPLIEAA